MELGEAPDGEIVKGNGLRASVEGQDLVIGTRKSMTQSGLKVSEIIDSYVVEREKQGNTAIFASVDGEVVAIISIADEISDDAFEALAEMRENGIKKMIMLTGDNQHTAKLVATKLGLDEYYAQLLPEDKVSHVKRLQAEGGTDVSMETADVVLMADKLTQFSHAYSLSKATIFNMKQNTFIAVGTVVLLLIGVLNGTVHLASGMFVHEASVLIVILNGMRLITFKPKKVERKPDLAVEHKSSESLGR